METYFCRIALIKSGILYVDLLNHLSSHPGNYTEWMLCREDIGTLNEHAHFYVKLVGVKKPAFVERLAKLSASNSFKGNRSYSVKTCECADLPMYAYMLKQGVYDSHNISDELIAKAYEHDVKVKSEMKERKRNLTQKIMDSMPSDISTMDLFRRRDAIAQSVITYFVETEKPFTTHKVLGYVNLILCKYDPNYIQQLSYYLFKDGN